ncbi:MAG: hypothetical protein AAFR70_08355, partial [Pseudomonadota bacterium]
QQLSAPTTAGLIPIKGEHQHCIEAGAVSVPRGVPGGESCNKYIRSSEVNGLRRFFYALFGLLPCSR